MFIRVSSFVEHVIPYIKGSVGLSTRVNQYALEVGEGGGCGRAVRRRMETGAKLHCARTASTEAG